MSDTGGYPDKIVLSGVGKKFNNRRIFNHIDYTFHKSNRIAVTGSNGSGKSTLLQIIAGYITPDEGSISWYAGESPVSADNIYRHLSFAGPYMDLIEQFSLLENVRFFARLRPLMDGITVNDVLHETGLEAFSGVQLQNFSSGMKQKVKLTFAFLCRSGMVLLDEPLSNLDERGYLWYHSMFERFAGERIFIVCSNKVEAETSFCTASLDVESFR